MSYLEVPHYPNEASIPVPAAGSINLGATPSGFWAVLSTGETISLQGGPSQGEFDALETRVTNIENDLSGLEPFEPGFNYFSDVTASGDVSIAVTGNTGTWITFLTAGSPIVTTNYGDLIVRAQFMYEFNGDEQIDFRGLLNGVPSNTSTLISPYLEAMQSINWGGLGTAQAQKTFMQYTGKWDNLVVGSYTFAIQLRFPAVVTLSGTFSMNYTTEKDQLRGEVYYGWKDAP